MISMFLRKAGSSGGAGAFELATPLPSSLAATTGGAAALVLADVPASAVTLDGGVGVALGVLARSSSGCEDATLSVEGSLVNSVGEDAGTFMAFASCCARLAYWVSVDPCIVEIVLLSVCGAADIFGEACNAKVVLLMVGCAKAFGE